eukprot:4836964-Ditylum_brightwellii.AAC.1
MRGRTDQEPVVGSSSQEIIVGNIREEWHLCKDSHIFVFDELVNSHNLHPLHDKDGQHEAFGSYTQSTL